ncbi:hypothetical protein AAHA92_12682 [Salvia divinorum]|uniref:Uncharacterized protein n=1 Tax=Salvia divinorum TaxID=28513 RepID=A0ABD1HM22_SALDI
MFPPSSHHCWESAASSSDLKISALQCDTALPPRRSSQRGIVLSLSSSFCRVLSAPGSSPAVALPAASRQSSPSPFACSAPSSKLSPQVEECCSSFPDFCGT